MAYITAMLLIDAPASALNNSDESIDRYENSTTVKVIRKRGGGIYPYVTAQAYRRWLRDTLKRDPQDWQMSHVYYEGEEGAKGNIAYPDANPIKFWDDDLLGYMRATKGCKENQAKRANDPDFSKMTPVEQKKDKNISYVTLTRISPLRVSTFVAISPVNLTEDFGVMSRQDNYPVLHAHNFYRATLQGLLSLDMSSAGVFTYSQRTGYQNLDSIRRQEAEQNGLEHLPEARAYRLPTAERLRRVRRLIEAIPLVQGGAKQTLHYTDVTPVVSIAAVTRYGNHPFNYLFEDRGDEITFKETAFIEVIRAYREQFLSPVYIGWHPGYAVNQAAKFNDMPDDVISALAYGTPHQAFGMLADALVQSPRWLD